MQEIKEEIKSALTQVQDQQTTQDSFLNHSQLAKPLLVNTSFINESSQSSKKYLHDTHPDSIHSLPGAMYSKSSFASIALTLVVLFQPCPAPPLAAIGFGVAEAASIAGGVGGGALAGGIGVAASKSNKDSGGKMMAFKRQDALSGLDLPEQAANDCRGQLQTATVNVSPVGDNGVRFDGVPSACMTLATVFLGNNPQADSAPIPMGSASLQYNNLTPDELQTLQNALDAKQS
ncbi:MAG: hypothetical protein L6R38_005759 [Xanthoria sp. 2 TBL-2021]|nr:MAG: hypothetical protein L6R38_005759 [Xanthoria sp. 2 TBL-2021]